MIDIIRNYWRVLLLVIFLTASLGIVFSPHVPGVDAGSTASDGTTSLQYSIDLAGGTRIRAPLYGFTATGIEPNNASLTEIEKQVANNLTDVETTSVIAREYRNESQITVEVTAKNMSEQRLSDALNDSNLTYETVQQGVTDQTRKEAVSVLRSKISQSGLSSGEVRTIQSVGGREYVLIQIPESSRQEAVDLITSRGSVRVDIYYPVVENGTRTYQNKTAVLQQEDFRTIGTAQKGEAGRPPNVPVTLTDSAAERFQEQVVETGVAAPGGSRCSFERTPESTDSCLLTVVDGKVVYSAGMSPSLAQSMQDGTWVRDPGFILQTDDYQQARELALNLRAGRLPAPLDLSDDSPGEITFIAPSQGEEFRLAALITGLLSTLAVSIVVSLRYKNVKIALPMVLTAFSEVIILLAFAAVLSYPVDLSVLAGLIAVIGTGVDDLIIIADRILGGDDVAKSTKVFQKRFRKALWVIFSAAGTTILAVGPLAVLNLYDLQGFAIFTIIGVVVGVTVTRPAYGDILRFLFTDK